MRNPKGSSTTTTRCVDDAFPTDVRSLAVESLDFSHNFLLGFSDLRFSGEGIACGQIAARASMASTGASTGEVGVVVPIVPCSAPLVVLWTHMERESDRS